MVEKRKVEKMKKEKYYPLTFNEIQKLCLETHVEILKHKRYTANNFRYKIIEIIKNRRGKQDET